MLENFHQEKKEKRGSEKKKWLRHLVRKIMLSNILEGDY